MPDPSASCAPAGMQAALALLVGLGGIEIIPLVRQVVLLQISLHLGVAPVKQRADLERAEVAVLD